MLTTAALVQAIDHLAAQLTPIRDRLNEADSTLGDGDTGMTVARMVEAVQAISAELPPDVGAALVQCGRACSRATGSSLGAVIAMALTAAGRSARGQVAVDRASLANMLAAASAIIQERSGATPGDKTVLDSLLAIRDACASAGPGALLRELAVGAAGDALEKLRGREAKLGRARMYGPRSAGLDDPGMLAVHLVLKAAGAPGAAA
jgi:dihydroxyacetone kinase-like protein